MPRITTATRTSLPVDSNKYNLNEEFRDYSQGNQYLSNSSLIFWSSLSDPGTVTSTMPGHDVVGLDGSTAESYTSHTVHSKAGVGFKSRRYEDKLNFCGDKNYFSYEANKGSALGTGNAYDSPMSLVFLDHDNLSFGNLGTDTGFTISFWVYSRIAAGLFDINEGGTNASGRPQPTFFEKYKEYSLQLDTSGRLRMTLYSGGTLASYIYTETTTAAFTDDTWNNIVVSYDGSMSPSGIKIYRNGLLINDPSRDTTVGTYSGMSNTTSQLTFGKGSPSNLEKQTSMPGLPGGGLKIAPVFISELAAWGKDLSYEEVNAVYHATLTCAATSTAQESGYTSEPPRLRIRSLDCATGSYPSINRTGDRDFRGNFGVSFDDLNTLVYGEKIIDEFSNIQPRENFSKRINPNIWSVSEGMEIRRETLSGFNGATFQDGVLVFTGATSRFIQTQRRLLNTNVQFELVQGPHNIASNALGGALRLEQGLITENLKVQYSITGGAGTWVTVKTFTPEPLPIFYGQAKSISIGDRGAVGFSQQGAEIRDKYRKFIDIHFSEFNTHGQPYYIRIVQEVASKTNKSVWGIGRIEIESMNQDIRYPLLVNHDATAGKRIVVSAIQTPHTRSDITAIGRTLPHASDHFAKFTPGENLSPFKEQHAVENLDPTDLFHAIGSDPTTGVTGFTSRLADKTKLTLTLGDDNTNLEIGHTDRHASDTPLTSQSLSGLIPAAPSGRPNYPFACRFMSFYKSATGNWHQSLTTPNHAYTGVAGGFDEFVKEDIHIGFGPIDNVASRSIKSTSAVPAVREQFGPDVLSNYARPIKTFGFPFSKKFERTEADCIKISDYIAKPFLLEKVIVDFKAAFEFAERNDLGERAYSLYTSFFDATASPNKPGERTAVGPRFFIPTFFILNQFKSSNTSKMILKNQQFDEASSTTKIVFNSIDYENEHISRDLITYGQMCLYASSSENYGVDVEKLVADGLGRDLNVDILDANGQGGIDLNTTSISAFTSSFKLEFPCRVSGKTDYNQKIILLTGSNVSSSPSDNLLNAYYTSDPTGGRSINNLERGSRGLVNNYVSRTPGEEYKTFGLYNSEIPSTVKTTSRETIDQYSPYILLPGDNLIFGWQYPVNTSYGFRSTGQTDEKRNIMRILGKVKVHLYGSLISDSSEHHEYSNAPLTSNAIHEVIGAEKVIDQFQIGTRGELSGSYVDRWVCFEEIWDHPTFGIDSFKIHADASSLPVERIGSLALSIASRKHNNMSELNSHTSTGIQYIASQLVSQLSEEDQVQRFARLKSYENMYLDSVYKVGQFYPNSSYGTLQTYQDLSGSLQTGGWNSTTRPWLTNNVIQTRVTPSRPKYYFNYRHFGFLSDKLQQGRDGKMFKQLGLLELQGISDTAFGIPTDENMYDISDQNASTVAVQFVSSSRNTDLSTLVYVKSTYDSMISGSGEIHKMYNSSLYATSSIPYRDHIRTLIFNENTR